MTVNRLLVASSAFMFAGAASAITPGLEFENAVVVTNQGWRSLTLGYEFVATAPVNVEALAYFDYSGSPSHEVGLWDETGALLASATVSNTDTLIGSFRYHAIAPVTLQSGMTYVVGGLNLGGQWAYNATSIQTASGIEYVQSRWSADSTSLTFPSRTYNESGYFGGSIAVSPVPEPGTFAMLMAGLGLVGALSRWKKA